MEFALADLQAGFYVDPISFARLVFRTIQSLICRQNFELFLFPACRFLLKRSHSFKIHALLGLQKNQHAAYGRADL
jgi:hypothetical protein